MKTRPMYDGVEVRHTEIVPGGLIMTLADGRTVYVSRSS